MRILKLEMEPLYLWPYLSAAPRGGTETQHLPLLQGKVDTLPAGLDALVVTSDLQGVAPCAVLGGAVALLGEVLADGLASLSAEGVLPPLAHTGVVLAGDLYSDDAALARGASGDVRSEWEAFGQQFRWVVGVAGNHDTFGAPREQAQFFRRARSCSCWMATWWMWTACEWVAWVASWAVQTSRAVLLTR